MKTEKDNVLTTDEEINKAIAEELGEEITKAEVEEKVEKGEGGDEEEKETDTNAKVEGGEGEEEEEEEVEKGGFVEKVEGEETVEKGISNEELQSAIEATPILKAFSERQDAIDKKLDTVIDAMTTMRKNNATITKGLVEKVGALETIEKAVEEIHSFGTGRKTFGARPEDRFEKAEGSEKILYAGAAQHRDAVIGVMEKAIFDDNGNLKKGVEERGLVTSMRHYVAANVIDKGLWSTEFAKEGITLQ